MNGLSGIVLFAATLVFLAPALQAQEVVAITPTPYDFFNSQSAHWVTGRAYDMKFTHNGGAVCGTTIQADLSGMPANFTWTSNGTTGELTGTFASAGKYSFRYLIKCPYSVTSGSYEVYVNEPMTMAPGPYLPGCNVGVQCWSLITQGGAQNFTGQVVSGGLPPGCALWGATYNVTSPVAEGIGCVPTTEGLYSFQVSVTDGLGETGTQSYSLMVGPPGAFYTSTNLMSFSGMTGGAAQTQPLAVATSDMSTVKYTVASDASWLTATPTSGSTPGSITVRMDPSKLGAGSTLGHLTLTPESGKQPVTVTVAADLQAPRPLIATAPESAEVEFSPVPGSPRAYQLGFHVWNGGTGTLNAQVSSFTDWLSLQPAQISLAAGQTQALTVNIDATSLRAGVYRGSVELQSSTQIKSIPVVLVVPATQYTPSLTVRSPGYGNWLLDVYQWSEWPDWKVNGWHALEIDIINQVPQAAMDWTAVLNGLFTNAHLTETSGHIAPGQGKSTEAILVKIGDLNPGRHEGLLTVTAPGATGSPANARLALNVISRAMTYPPHIYVAPLQAEIDTPAVVVPSGTKSVAAQLKITNPSNMPVSFTATSPSSTVTLDPPSGSAAASATTTVNVKVDTSSAPVTVEQFEQIMLSFDRLVGGGSNSVCGASMAAMVTAAYGLDSPEPQVAGAGNRFESAGACVPGRIVMAPTAPANYAAWLADWPVKVGAAVFDDCGHALADAAVTASFSNGDAGLALPLQDAAKGLYQATWIPGAAAGITITVRATKGALTPATAQIFGSVVPDADSPVVSSIVNNVNPGSPAVPGGTVAISGSNLGGATSVLIGGVQAQVLSAGAGQIVAKVPATLAGNARCDVVVAANDRYSTPKSIVLGAAQAQAQALYFPHVDTSLPWQTEIAVINTSDQTVTGTLRALSSTGQLVDSKDVTLAAHGRRQIIVANEFANSTNIGHIVFDTDPDAVQGYTKFYQAGIYRAAIPAVREVNAGDIIISHIDQSSLWWTGVSLVNTTSAQKDLTITFNNGVSVPYTLNASEHKAFTIGSLLNQQLQPNIQSAVISNASGVIGLELFGSMGAASQMDGLLITDKTATTIYYPHVASDNIWWTGIVAYNPSTAAVTITITPYSAQGSALTPTTITIPAKGKYVGLVSALGLPNQTAWFRIDSPSPLSGFELFATWDGQLLGAYVGGGTGAKSGVFPKIEKNGWTGIAFVNTEANAASVTLTAYNDSGTVVASQSLSIGGYAKMVNYAETIFAGKDISGATYIAYSSDKNVVGFQLNGSADGTMLDGLPAM